MKRLGLAAIVGIALASAVTTRTALADEDAGAPEDAAIPDAGGPDATTIATPPPPPPPPPPREFTATAAPEEELPPPPKKPRRGAGELPLLYMLGIQWGGTIAFVIDAAAEADHPYASASPVILLAPLTAGVGVALPMLVDRLYGYKPGAAQTVSSSMLIGLAEGIAWNEYFSNRATTSFHTYTKDVLWVFGGETVGLATGLAVAAFEHTTHGGAAWVETTGLFGGFFAASVAGAISRYPSSPTNWTNEGNRNVGITGALMGLAGTAAGIATVDLLHPSILRVHLIDLGWLTGAIVPTIACFGSDSGTPHRCSAPDTFMAAAIGSGIGFLGTYIATSWLPKDFGKDKPLPVHPYMMPSATGGIELGIGGSL